MPKDMLFISYSRRDKDFVDRLAGDLQQAGFNTWRDTDALTPGTANWEKAIRKAIQDSVALIYVASPTALESEYVQGELAVARLNGCPIFPIWATGDQWINSAPFDMVHAQYVDGRQNYSKGFAKILESVRAITDESMGKVRIGLPAHDIAIFNIALFPDLITLLNKIYMSSLIWWCKPFRYGSDWVLGNVSTRQLALPWEWLEVPIGQPLFTSFPDWDTGTLDDYNIKANSYWGVWDFSKFHTIGIALNNHEIARRLRSETSIYDLISYYKNGSLKLKKHPDVNPEKFTYKFFVGMVGMFADYGTTLINQYADGTPVDFATLTDKVVLVDSE